MQFLKINHIIKLIFLICDCSLKINKYFKQSFKNASYNKFWEISPQKTSKSLEIFWPCKEFLKQEVENCCCSFERKRKEVGEEGREKEREDRSQKLLIRKPIYIRWQVYITKENPWMNQTGLIILVEIQRKKFTKVKKHLQEKSSGENSFVWLVSRWRR